MLNPSGLEVGSSRLPRAPVHSEGGGCGKHGSLASLQSAKRYTQELPVKDKTDQKGTNEDLQECVMFEPASCLLH